MTQQQPDREPATQAGTTTPAAADEPAQELQREVAGETDSVSPNSEAAGTDERAPDEDDD